MLLAIAGNTGSGKSTLISLMMERLGNSWRFVPESVDDNPFLEPYGEDPVRWGFALQAHFLERRRRAYIEAREQLALRDGVQGVILDRTLLEGVSIFVPNMLDVKFLNAQEGELHDRMVSAYGGQKSYAPDLLIYLRRPAEVAHRQVRRRARHSDENIVSIDFLRDLEGRYDQWFAGYGLGSKLLWDAGEDDYLGNPDLFDSKFQKVLKWVDEYAPRPGLVRSISSAGSAVAAGGYR